jgi:exopolyphosphatase/guanosine-5'-triphosphate,3'-diphosphate pyrophosphatase
MRRIASIDIGTNTALLLVAEVTSEGEINPLIQKETIVRLGEGVDKSGKLKETAVQRTLITIDEYIKVAKELEVDDFVVSGSSALRDAENQDLFLRRCNELFGFDVQVLTGEDEARLTYFGALSNKRNLQGRIFLVDIGGGSTEFIWGNQREIEHVISLNIGSVRLTERCVKHDPITDNEFDLVKQEIKAHLDKVDKKWHARNHHFIGVAGTVTTLAAMYLKVEPYDSDIVDGSGLTLQHIVKIIEELRVKSIDERRVIPGLKPERADVILAGAIILLESMKYFASEKVIVSDRGLRFGLILKFLNQDLIEQRNKPSMI